MVPAWKASKLRPGIQVRIPSRARAHRKTASAVLGGWKLGRGSEANNPRVQRPWGRGGSFAPPYLRPVRRVAARRARSSAPPLAREKPPARGPSSLFSRSLYPSRTQRQLRRGAPRRTRGKGRPRPRHTQASARTAAAAPRGFKFAACAFVDRCPAPRSFALLSSFPCLPCASASATRHERPRNQATDARPQPCCPVLPYDSPTRLQMQGQLAVKI